MKKRWLFLILFGCVASLTIAFALWPRENETEDSGVPLIEPEYNGIRLSKYLERAAGAPNGEFNQAIKHMGTNALPFLVRAVDYHPARWRISFSLKILRLPWKKLSGRVGLWLLDEKSLRRAECAVIAFGILGRDARPVLDDLRRMASRNPTSFAGQAILRIQSAFRGYFDFDLDRIPSWQGSA
jgi:hypothetical protein